jgi:citronellol/citronellal dehydrogenase
MSPPLSMKAHWFKDHTAYTMAKYGMSLCTLGHSAEFKQHGIGVNVRGTFVCSQACLPYLKQSAKAGRNPHILNLSPPLSMKARWFAPHVAYTMAKYGMSMCVLGMAEEFKHDGIGVNALWPRTVIATAALQVIPMANPKLGRTPDIMADAAYTVLTRDARTCTGNFFIDDEVLASAGVTDLDRYAVTPGNRDFLPDFFVD